MSLDYDSKFDILYITLGDRANTVCTEEQDGVMVFRDRDTREITGVTVMNAGARMGRLEQSR